MLLQMDFLIWLWTLAGIPFLFFGIPSFVLQIISIEFENVIIDRYLSTGFEDLKPIRQIKQPNRFGEWCIRKYDGNYRRYDFFVNATRVLSVVFLLCFGYLILWILGIIFFSFFSYRQLVRIKKRPNIEERSKFLLQN